MPALALTVQLDPAVWHDTIVRVLAGGLGALAGLMLLTFGIVVSLARMRWPGR